MSQTSTHLNLPYIQPAQAQKHVTHNEAVELLDMIVQLTVMDFDAETPATSPNEGDTWALGAAPTGDWAGQAGMIATWRGGGWLFVAPVTGWRAYGVTPAEMRVYDGADWTSATGTPVLENLAGVGINATSDATNKLAVSADATLLNHAGSGHQVKVNKATAGDTAALLYQSNFSGRAEMGLAGNDDFSVKVSDDGTTFTEALRIEAATGHVDLPASRTRQFMPYNYRHYLYGDHRWTAPTSNPASQNASQSLGTGATLNIDWDAKGLFLPAGSVLHALTLAGHVNSSEVTDLDLRAFVLRGPWDGTWTSSTQATHDILLTQDDIGWTGGAAMQRTTHALSFTMPADGYFMLAVRAKSTSVITTTRYANIAGHLEVSCPPTP